jgi:16S rRNA G966 N2-methylase RsmD
MIKHLGLPYMGSKRKIASKIVDEILDKHPNTKYVYDLFGGGGAISFEFMQRKQIKKVFYNEYDKRIVNLLKDIKQNGITNKYYKFIDRQTFLDNIGGSDWFAGYLATCWSFGNKGESYLYGKEVEKNKKLGHEYVFNNKQIKSIEETTHKDIDKRRKILNTQAKNKFKELYIEDIKEDYKKYIKILNTKYTRETFLKFTTWFKSTGITVKKIKQLTNSDIGSHYLSTNTQPLIPTLEMWKKIKPALINVNIPLWIEDLFSKDEKYKKDLLEKFSNKEKLQHLQHLQRLQHLQHLEHLQRLEHLERLQHLQNLQHLEHLHQQTILNNLEISNESYENVKIITPKNETIIYLDPPYEGTATYKKDIDHKKLLNYIKKSHFNIYASSYDMPLDCVLKIEHISTLSSTNNSKVVFEKLFCNKTTLNNRIIKKESLFDF